MTARKMKIREDMLGPFDIRAARNLEDAEYYWRELFKDNPPSTRQDIAPAGWSKVRWAWNKVMFTKGETL